MNIFFKFIAKVMILAIFTFSTLAEASSLLFPRNYSKSILKGISFLQDKDYQAAVEFFNAKLNQYPENAENHVFLSIAYRYNNDYGAAARELAEACFNDPMILQPNYDLLLQIGFKAANRHFLDKTYSFLPRYRIDDEISFKARLSLKSFWDENNQLYSRRDSVEIKGLASIGNPKTDGTINGKLSIYDFRQKGGVKVPLHLILKKNISFIFSPIFGLISVDMREFSSSEIEEICKSLLLALFPPLPPKFVHNGENVTISELYENNEHYVGVAHFEFQDEQTGKMTQKLLFLPEIDQVDEQSTINRTVYSKIDSALPEKIQLRWQLPQENGINKETTYEVNINRLSFNRGRVELPLYPSTTMLVNVEKTENEITPTPIQQDLYHTLIYKIPEYKRIEKSDNEITPTATAKGKNEIKDNDIEQKIPTNSLVYNIHSKNTIKNTPTRVINNSLIYSDFSSNKPTEKPEITPLPEFDVSQNISTPSPKLLKSEKKTDKRNEIFFNPTPLNDITTSESKTSIPENLEKRKDNDKNDENYNGLIVPSDNIKKSNVKHDETKNEENETTQSDEENEVFQKSENPKENYMKNNKKLNEFLNKITIPPPPVPVKKTIPEIKKYRNLKSNEIKNKLHLKPRDPFLKVKLGQAFLIEGYKLSSSDLLKSGELIAKARNQFKEALKISSNKLDLLIYIGNAWFIVGMYDEALSYFQKALYKGKRMEIYAGASLCYAQLNTEFIKSIVMAKKALSKAKIWENYQILGWVYYKNRDFVSAINNYNKAIKSGGKDISLTFYRGLAYLKQNNFNKAKKDFKTVFDTTPNSLFGKYAQQIITDM